MGAASRAGLHEIAWKLPITMWRQFYGRTDAQDWIGCTETALASALDHRRAVEVHAELSELSRPRRGGDRPEQRASTGLR